MNQSAIGFNIQLNVHLPLKLCLPKYNWPVHIDEDSPGALVELLIFSLSVKEVAENPTELPAMHVYMMKSFFVMLLK